MAESCAALGTFAKGVIRARWCIIAFWLVAALLAALGAINFLSVTSLPFDPPENTPAKAANDHVLEVFPSRSRSTQFVGLLEAQPPRSALDIPNLADFSVKLRDTLNQTGRLVSFISNATLYEELGIAEPGLVNGSATILQWEIAEKATSKVSLAFSDFSVETFDKLVAQHLPDLRFHGVVSLPTLCNVGVEDSEKSLARMDAIAMPIAVLVLWYIIQSGRLLLLPLATMGTAASVSFGVMYCVGRVAVVEETTPSLMMSLLIAMSIDYSLFLLTRFREELRRLSCSTAAPEGVMVPQILACIEATMQTAGFTVLLSGLTLTASFLGVAFFPVTVISSLGVGCSVSLLLTLIVHLTLGPALLAAFPSFFSKCVSSERLGARVAGRLGGGASAGGTSGPAVAPAPVRLTALTLEDGSSTASSAALVPREAKEFSPFWVWLARITTSFPRNIVTLGLVVGLTCAVGWQVRRVHISDNLMMMVPRGTPLYSAYEHLIDNFGIGTIAPYQLLLEPPNGGSVLDQHFWERSQQMLVKMADGLPNTKQADFQFVNFVGSLDPPLGPSVPWGVLELCGQDPSISVCKQLQYTIDKFCNPERTATFGYIILRFDPFGNEGPAWLDAARSLADSLGKEFNVRVTLTGTAGDSLDILSKVYEFFPYMVAGTLTLALLLLGFAFQSVVMPLRSVASICLTLLFVYGFAVLTYQDGWLEFTKMSGVTGAFNAQNWMIPVICFSIVVGICLDYDIFLLSRTTELREGGMSALEAVRDGLCGTGGIITAAGLVMAIAFGGLLFSDLLIVNGLAFYMVVAVLYDTIVVRCLMTPAVMSLLGRWNWWPSKLYKDGHATGAGPLHIDPASGETWTSLQQRK